MSGTDSSGPPDIGRRFVRGALYVGAANWGTYILNFVIVLAVARLLGPERFGVYAFAIAINEFINIISGFAIAPALVQSREESQELFDTGAAMSLGLGLIGLAIAGAVAPWVWIQRDPEPALFLLVLGVVRILILLNDVAFAKMDRTFLYGPMAAIHLAARSLPNLACLALVWNGVGPWGLVLRDLMAAGLTFVLVQPLSRYRFRGRVRREAYRRIMSFAAPVFVARTLDVVLLRFDRFMVGSLLGNAAIGLYHQARYVAEAGQLATNPVMRVTLNLYSRLQDDARRLARSYALVNYALVRALFGGAAVLLVFPEQTIRLLLGDEWLGAAPLIRILALHAALFPLLDNMKILLIARAQMGATVRLRVVQLVVFLPLVTAAALAGSLDGVAAGLAVSTLLGTLTAGAMSGSVLRGALRGLYGVPLIAMALTSAALLALASAGRLDALPFWALPFLPALAFWGLVVLLERARLFREARYLWGQLRSRGDGADAGLS